VARREVAFHAKDADVAEKAASRIVAKLLAGPMAALRRTLQRGEPLDQHAMMLLEMFAPAGGAGASQTRTTGSPRAVSASEIPAAAARPPAQPSAPVATSPAAPTATVPPATPAVPLMTTQQFT
jgi:hypothetical protein